MTATPELTKVGDADKSNMSEGAFTVSRPSTATEGDLTVYLSYGGTAESGVDYEALPASVVIPNGLESVTVSVSPIYSQASEDRTLVVSLVTDGVSGYIPDSNSSVEVKIFKAVLNSTYNIWIGSGNASVSTNWSQGLPKETDQILIGAYSQGDLVWDAPANGLPVRVASWTQEAAYTGMVYIATMYENASDSFPCFTVTGDVTLEGGTMLHPKQSNWNEVQYRLKMNIGGSLTIGENASINVYEKGYAGGDAGGPGGWAKPGGATSVAAHGGYSGLNDANLQSDWIYGSVFEPRLPGSHGQAGCGGGAVWLEVSGPVTVNGHISADGSHTKWGGGSGGSIYLSCPSLSGTGYIVADGGQGVNPWAEWEGWGPCGGGGRVAVYLTEADAVDTVRLFARGGQKWSDDRRGGPGTVYVQTASQMERGGRIYINNDWRSWDNRCRAGLPGTFGNVYAGELATPEESYERTTLVLQNVSFFDVRDDLTFEGIETEENSVIFLNGYHVWTKYMNHRGEALIPGNYTSETLNGLSGEGTLTVLPAMTMFLLH